GRPSRRLRRATRALPRRRRGVDRLHADDRGAGLDARVRAGLDGRLRGRGRCDGGGGRGSRAEGGGLMYPHVTQFETRRLEVLRELELAAEIDAACAAAEPRTAAPGILAGLRSLARYRRAKPPRGGMYTGPMP